MKSIKLFVLIVSLFCANQVIGQSGLNFQGVARNENGVILASQEMSLRLSIVQGSVTGVVEFSEIRKTTTNAQGLFSVVIGGSNALSTLGNFNAIDWKLAPKFLKIEMDITGGENFTLIGTTQLQSVAYAKYAESVDATNVNGIVPVSKGGTGKNNLEDFKIALNLNEKANLASPAFTGTVTGITKTMVGLGDVDNTTDLNKPISTSTQTALDLKASIIQLNTKEELANKSTNVATDAASDIKYPSAKAVKTFVDNAILSGVPDATDAIKGKILLAGALTGTASLPAIANNTIGTDQLLDVSVSDAKIISVTGSKISGDITGNANNITGVASLANGGTGANNASTARTNLGLTIGTNVEFPLTVSGPLTRVSNAIGIPVASSSVNGYLASTDWTNFNNKMNASEKGANNGIATLDASGKIPSVQIPAISFQSANVVASQSAMLALSNAVEGSIAIRTDNSKNYVLSTTPASTLSNWIELATPSSVASVNGFTGPNVSLTTDNIAEGSTNKYYSNTQARNAISATAPLTYDASTGVIALPVASTSQDGYITSVDWNSFNNKQGSLTAGTGVTISSNTISIGQNVSTTANPTFASVNGIGIKLINNDQSIGIGNNSLPTNITNTGFGNLALGNNTLSNNTTGYLNTAIGQSSLSLNTTGFYNTGLGYGSLGRVVSGGGNTALGGNSMPNTTGYYNTGIGYQSLFYNTTGSNNVAVGRDANITNTTGSNNTMVGFEADATTNNLNNATAIGNQAKVNTSNTIQLGNPNVTNIKTAGKLTTGAVTYPNTDGVSGQILSTTGAGTITWTTLTGISSQTITTTSLAEPFDISTITGYRGSSIDIRTAENLANGTGSLSSNTDGIANIAVGIRTLKSNTTGSSNTALGFESLYNNTVGYVNTAVGAYSLRSNTTGAANTAIGSTALLSNTTGVGNVGLGEWTLMSNTTASGNTAIGTNSMFQSTTGAINTAVGFNSLFSNKTGNVNTGIGTDALYGNITGSNNTAIGRASLPNNTTGSYNTALGNSTLFRNTTGINNLSIGYNALNANIEGSNNIGIGYGANLSSSNLNNAIAIGANSMVTSSNTIQLGNGNITDVKTAGKLTTGAVTYPNIDGINGQILSTTGSGTLTWTTPTTTDLSNITGVLSIAKGGTGTSTQNFVDLTEDQTIAGTKIFSSGALALGLSNRGANTSALSFPSTDDPAFISHYTAGNIGRMFFSAGDDATVDYFAFGYGLLNSFTEKLKIYADGRLTAPVDANINGLTIGKGNNSSLIGNTIIGNTALASNSVGQYNTAIGNTSMRFNISGNANTAVGNEALQSNTSGSLNIAVGANALQTNTSGSENTVVGNSAMYLNTTGAKNTALGYYALRSNTIGAENTATGDMALYANTEGNFNTANGSWALYANNVGSYNTSFGHNSTTYNTSGNRNTSVGAFSLYKSTNANNNTSIGAYALQNNNTGSGNTSTGANSMYDNSIGEYNTANGFESLKRNTSGTNNTSIGAYSSLTNSTGNDNTSIGASALYAHSTGNFNTAVGSNALFYDQTGVKNTAIGYKADVASPDLINATAIGSEAVVGESNTIALGNPFVTKVITAGTLTAGTVTYPNTHGTSGQILTTTGSGTLTWTASVTHYVGEVYGGGIVFYVYDNGQHGLIVSNDYQSTGAYWRAGSDIRTMALADGIGAGKKNTAIIIASQGYGNGDLYAARICNEYSVTDANGVTYGDWYLPSKTEALIMKNQYLHIPNYLYSRSHWTSSESTSDSAYYMSNGSAPVTQTKNNFFYVRAIRSF